MNKSLLLVFLCAILGAIGIFCIISGIDMNDGYSKLKRICTEEMQAIVIDFHVSGEIYWDHGLDNNDRVDERLFHPIYEYIG